jgi:hypothetical protein
VTGEAPLATTGVINVLVPAGFMVRDGQIFAGPVGDMANSTAIDTFSLDEADGTTRITIWGANLGEVRYREFWYVLDYVGDGFGVSLANLAAEYRSQFEWGTGSEQLTAVLRFPQPLVAITPNPDMHRTAANRSFRVSENARLDILGTTLHNRMADIYSVNPTVIMTNAAGTPIPYNRIETPQFTAYIDPGGNFDYGLSFIPVPGVIQDGDTFTFYFRIMLTATSLGRPDFVLNTDVQSATVTFRVPPACTCADCAGCADCDCIVCDYCVYAKEPEDPPTDPNTLP